MTLIYKIINLVNGKLYIGKTTNTIEKRFKQHCLESRRDTEKNRPLYAAMRKYGVEHFQVEEIDRCEDDIEGCEKEKYWIEFYETFKNGYNATIGGDGRPYLDYDLVISTYKAVGSCRKTAQHLGIRTETVSRILRARSEDYLSANDSMRKISSKTVQMYSKTNEYIRSFSAINDAAKYIQSLSPTSRTNLSGISSHISAAARGKRKSAYGYLWKMDN